MEPGKAQVEPRAAPVDPGRPPVGSGEAPVESGEAPVNKASSKHRIQAESEKAKTFRTAGFFTQKLSGLSA